MMLNRLWIGAVLALCVLASVTAHAAPLLYVTNQSAVTVINTDGSQTTLDANGGGSPTGIARTPGNVLYVSNGDSTLTKIAADGSTSYFGFSTAFALRNLLPLADGTLLLAASNEVDKLSASGTDSVFAYVPGSTLEDIKSDAQGNLYVSSFTNDAVYRLAATSNSRSTFATLPAGAFGLAFDSTGDLFVSLPTLGEIEEVMPNGTEKLFASGLAYPAGIAFGQDGNLYVACRTDNTIQSINPSGQATPFATGISGPVFLTFADPTPEPAGSLMLVGMSMLGVFPRRRFGR